MDINPVIKTNKNWKNNCAPYITVFTSVYNRRKTLPRTMESVNKQTFRDIEYIIVNNGSTEPLDDVVQQFMDETDIPVMYIKKAYGGVHTGRNMGLRYARGKLVVCIDSDDELLPAACETFYSMWQAIPDENRDEYATLRAQCMDQDGNIAGTLFPEDVNSQPYSDVRRYFTLSKGEQITCNVTKILQKYYWPEPEGVAHVGENALWVPVEYDYKSWGTNEVLRIFHTEGDDHITDFALVRKKTMQDCRDSLWNAANAANQAEMFCLNYLIYLKAVLRYCVMHWILRKDYSEFVKKYPLTGKGNKFWEAVFWLPSFVGAAIYKKTRM